MAERKRRERVEYEISWDDHHITLKFQTPDGKTDIYEFDPDDLQGLTDDLTVAVMEFFTDFDEQ